MACNVWAYDTPDKPEYLGILGRVSVEPCRFLLTENESRIRERDLILLY